MNNLNTKITFNVNASTKQGRQTQRKTSSPADTHVTGCTVLPTTTAAAGRLPRRAGCWRCTWRAPRAPSCRGETHQPRRARRGAPPRPDPSLTPLHPLTTPTSSPRGRRRRRRAFATLQNYANNMRSSQAVTHQSTDRTQRPFTAGSGRDPVYLSWYGRWPIEHTHTPYLPASPMHPVSVLSGPARALRRTVRSLKTCFHRS